MKLSICMKCQSLYSEKKKKKSKCRLLKFLLKSAKRKIYHVIIQTLYVNRLVSVLLSRYFSFNLHTLWTCEAPFSRLYETFQRCLTDCSYTVTAASQVRTACGDVIIAKQWQTGNSRRDRSLKRCHFDVLAFQMRLVSSILYSYTILIIVMYRFFTVSQSVLLIFTSKRFSFSFYGVYVTMVRYLTVGKLVFYLKR